MGKQEYKPKLITITDSEDGKEYQFAELDRIQCEEGRFIALMPTEEELRISDDSFLVLRLIEEGGKTQLQPIENDDLFQKVGMLIQEHMLETYDPGD